MCKEGYCKKEKSDMKILPPQGIKEKDPEEYLTGNTYRIEIVYICTVTETARKKK